jgi:NTE family protein
MNNIFGRTKLGLVLGGGGARAGAHAGVLHILEEIGYVPDLIVGTSMGGIISVLYGAGLRAAQIKSVLLEASFSDLIFLDRTGQGLIGTDRLASFLQKHIGNADLRDLKPDVVLMATDLEGRRAVMLEEGPAIKAVLATSAIPGLFPAVEWAGRTLVDGGVLSNVPTQAAYQLGANRLVAVDVSGGNYTTQFALENVRSLNAQVQRALYWLLSLSKREMAFETWIKSAMLTNDRLTDYHLAAFPPDVLIQPAMDAIGLFSMEMIASAIVAGEEAARESQPEISKLLRKRYHFRRPPAPAGRVLSLSVVNK